MDYYTWYTVSASKDMGATWEDLKDHLHEIEDEDSSFKDPPPESEHYVMESTAIIAADVLEHHLYSDWPSKWYEHAVDMITLSRRCPNILFQLHGGGEESGDIWSKYFLNGKMQVAEAVVAIPPFDPEKLKDFDPPKW